nr:MAG TPA: hypothetical protein [Caudoviricetes sp.]
MVKYVVIDERNGGIGDRFEEYFDTIEAANKYAINSWFYLTEIEKKKRHIFAAVIREEDLAEYAKDEESGEIDWREWISCHTTPQLFDSALMGCGNLNIKSYVDTDGLTI